MQEPTLIWLEADDAFPPPELAWGKESPMPGLLAAGGTLDAAHLQAAYRQGIFPGSAQVSLIYGGHLTHAWF